jgi:hypothetical protein
MILVLSSVLVTALCGCSRSEQVSKSNEFFATWLQAHGESNVVVDASGVGLKGNATRLRYKLYGSERTKNGGWSAELEFRVRIPDGREIVEYVSGTGDTPEKAGDDAKLNFLLSTFHVVYRSFMNPSDPHQREESILIGGQPRALVLGDSMTRGETTNSAPDMFPLREGFRKIVAAQPLSPQAHWIKIIYANHRSKVMMCAVTLDNEDSPALTAAVKDLPWPRKDEFYMVKQFLVVK